MRTAESSFKTFKPGSRFGLSDIVDIFYVDIDSADFHANHLGNGAGDLRLDAVSNFAHVQIGFEHDIDIANGRRRGPVFKIAPSQVTLSVRSFPSSINAPNVSRINNGFPKVLL